MDNYDRIRVLGKGSYGKAWLVNERTSKEQFVIKEIRVQNQREMDEALAEAAVLSKLNHINIIKYSKLIRISTKVVCIVMEFADDGDLSEKIGRRRVTNQLMDEPMILGILVQTTQALFYLHSRGILHRDIKTANLFMNKNGIVKLGDFGIARILEDNADRISARTCRTAVGTPLYMSPELCTGASYGQKADMWALGCVLYEMCALKPAFTATSIETLMVKIRKGQREQRISMTYSEDLRGLISNLLNVDPKIRPSARDMLLMPFLQRYINEAPATIHGFYDPPSGATPRLDSRHTHAPHLMVKQSSAKPQSRPDVMVIDHLNAARRRVSQDHDRAAKPQNLHPPKGKLLRAGSLNEIDKGLNLNAPLPIVGRADSVPDLSDLSEITPAQMRKIEEGLHENGRRAAALRDHRIGNRSDSANDRRPSPLSRRASEDKQRSPHAHLPPANHLLPKQPSPLAMPQQSSVISPPLNRVPLVNVQRPTPAPPYSPVMSPISRAKSETPTFFPPNHVDNRRLSLPQGPPQRNPVSVSAQNSPAPIRKNRSSGEVIDRRSQTPTAQFEVQLSHYRDADGVAPASIDYDEGVLPIRKYNSMQALPQDHRHKKPPMDLQELSDFYRNGYNMPPPPSDVKRRDSDGRRRDSSPNVPRHGKLPSLF